MRFFFIISAIGSMYFLASKLGYIKWILPAIFLTILYTAPKFPLKPFSILKKFILGKTIFTGTDVDLCYLLPIAAALCAQVGSGAFLTLHQSVFAHFSYLYLIRP